MASFFQSLRMKFLSLTIQTKASKHYFPTVLFANLYKVVLESVEIVKWAQ